jgi:alpha-L-rhamnosidase
MKRSFFLAWTFAVLFSCAIVGSCAALIPSDLRCEYLEEPIAVESSSPRLSWSLRASTGATAQQQMQSAYRIMVSATETGLLAGASEI